MKFIELLEQSLGKKAIKDFQPMQAGDVIDTAADTSALESWIDFRPSTPLKKGIEHFAKWYTEYYAKN